jgi:hypothetical protein
MMILGFAGIGFLTYRKSSMGIVIEADQRPAPWVE